MIKKRLEWAEECDTYLTHVHRYLHSVKRLWRKHKDWELSANTVAFISCRHTSQVGVALFPSL